MRWRSVRFFVKRYLFLAIWFVWLQTLGLLKADNRRVHRRIAQILGYHDVKPDLPSRQPSEVLQGKAVPVRLFSEQRSTWNTSAEELIFLNQVAVIRQPRQVFEIGTFDGRTALNLAMNLPGSQVFTLNLPPDQVQLPDNRRVGEMLDRVPVEAQVHQLFGDTRTFDYAPYLGNIDLVFIDASHAYDNVVIDSNNALKLIEGKDQAMIIWHDYFTIEGVTRAVNELAARLTSDTFVHVSGTTMACLVRGHR